MQLIENSENKGNVFKIKITRESNKELYVKIKL